MAIKANVRNKQIDTGKVLHALVQGEHASGNITFRIIGEAELMEDIDSTYFYLLYTRPSDTHANVLLLTGKQIVDAAIEVTFKPTSYFTAQDGTVQIQIMATDTAGLSVDSETGTISGSIIWQTFPGAMFVHASQLTGTETIIEENVLTQYLTGMQDLNTQTEQAAAAAQNAKSDAVAARDKAAEWAEKETAVETGKYSAKHWAEQAHAEFNALETYVDETLKPALDGYEETKEGELDTYTATKKAEINTYTGTKKTELDTYTGTKKGELDAYVTNTNKPALDNYTTAKEGVLDSYVNSTSKPSIDDYVDDTVKPALDEYVEDILVQEIEEDDTTHVPSGDAVFKALEEKADKNGYYAGLTAGNAEQLLSSTLIHDQAIYTDRTAGGGEDIGNKSYQKSITGVTVCENQPLKNPMFTSKSNWSKGDNGSWAVNNGVASFSTVNTNTYNEVIRQNVTASVTTNNYYYVRFRIKVTPANDISTTVVSLSLFNSAWQFTSNNEARIPCGEWTFVSMVIKAVGANTKYFAIGLTRTATTDVGVGTLVEISEPNLVDISQKLTPSVVTYIGTLSKKEGAEFYEKYFGTKAVDYIAPSLQSVCVSSHNTTQFNQYNNATGTARILANEQYRIKGTYSTLAFADLSGNALSITVDSDGLFTSSVEAILTVTGGNNTDTCVYIYYDDSKDDYFEPYTEHEYPMDSDVVLRGIPKLDASNNLYYDGDTYSSDGTVTTKTKEIDLSQPNFTYDSTNGYWKTGTGNTYFTGIVTNDGKFVAEKYTPLAIANWNNKTNGNILINEGNAQCFVVSSDSTTPPSGKIVCKLNSAYYTVNTTDYDPFTEEQVVDNWGTEAFTDGLTRDVFVPPMATADYTQNLRDKLEASPSTPDADGLYLMKRENGQNTYVAYTSPIPTESTDGTYVLKATVADGAMTLAWVTEGE